MATAFHRTCPACHTVNRIPARHLAHTGRCGSCKTELPPLGEPLEVDSAAFDSIVDQSRVPVLVDFWAAWCGPCRVAAPEVAALAREMAGRAVVLKVDTEQEPELATRFGVRSIPNFAIFRQGRLALQQAGLVSRSDMRRWLESS